MKHHLRESAIELGVSLEEGQADRLRAFEDLLRDRAGSLGLIGPGPAASLRERHILDCLRAAPYVRGRVVDLGSGAGLPGVVLAIARPDAAVYLVDARRRSVAFLELAVERLGLTNAVPVLGRFEDMDGAFQTATARAFAHARKAWAAAEGLLAPGGTLVYFAGARFERSEIEDLGVVTELVPAAAPLASSGPLVIMTRQ